MSAWILSHFSHVQYFATLWTVACQAATSLGFSIQEYWSGLSFPSPGDFPNVAIQPASLASWVLKYTWTYFLVWSEHCMGFTNGACGKESAFQCGRWDVGDVGLIYWLGRSPGGGHGNPLQYSCQSQSRGGQRSLVGYTVHEGVRSWIRLKRFSMHTWAFKCEIKLNIEEIFLTM